MPGKNNASAAKGKGFNKKNQFADKANKKVLTAILTEGIDTDSMRYAKVTKMSGNSRILVDLTDGRDNVSALIRTVLRGKAATPIGPGSIVLVGLPNWARDAELALANGGTLDAKPEAYVEAVIDKKTARALAKEGQIPERFLKDLTMGGSEEEDNGFDFDDECEDEVVIKKAVGGAGAPPPEEEEEEETEEKTDKEKSKGGKEDNEGKKIRWKGNQTVAGPEDNGEIFNFE
jgi:hypothetical protein